MRSFTACSDSQRHVQRRRRYAWPGTICNAFFSHLTPPPFAKIYSYSLSFTQTGEEEEANCTRALRTAICWIRIGTISAINAASSLIRHCIPSSMVSDFLMSNVVVSVSYSKRRGRRHILKSPEAQQHQGQGMMLSSCSKLRRRHQRQESMQSRHVKTKKNRKRQKTS